jgi:hypothetical protein
MIEYLKSYGISVAGLTQSFVDSTLPIIQYSIAVVILVKLVWDLWQRYKKGDDD